MSRVSFDSTKRPLEELLKQAHAGIIQLPDFQRSWVWKDDGLRALLASVSRSFPVGTLMTLQTGGEVNFKRRLIEGAPEEHNSVTPDFLLLDGQQRVTSLYQLVVRQDVIETQNVRKQPIRRWYYIDMNRALDSSVDREMAIVGAQEDKKEQHGSEVIPDLSEPHLEYAKCMFPTNKVFLSDVWQMEFCQYWQFAPDKMQLWFRFANEILAAFKQYQMPVIALDKSTSREAVCLVFEKVNTGGEKLDAFELLTAIYAAFSFDLRADWRGGGEAGQGRAKRLAASIAFPKNVLTQLQPTDFLQAICLLNSLERRRKHNGVGEPPPVTAKREDLLRIHVDDFRRLSPIIEAGFIAAAKLLFAEHVFAARDLPYHSQLIPLAVLMADLGPQTDILEVRSKLLRWWWCGVFGELYGSASETRYVRDVQEVPIWIRGGEEPTTIRDATFRAERLDTMSSRLSAAYKGVHVLLMRAGARDFRSGQSFGHSVYFGEYVDIHHIFPRDWCSKNRIKPGRMDAVINKTPLFYKTNRIIGGSAPSIYLSKLVREGSVSSDKEQDSILKTHGIAPDTMRQNDFDNFYFCRRQSLLKMIEAVMGKSAYSADSAEFSDSENSVSDIDEDENLIEEDESALPADAS